MGVLDYVFLRTWLGTPDPDTSFVLGSGAYVEVLTQRDMETNRSQVPVGINACLLHHFLRTVCTYGPVPVDRGFHYKTMLRVLFLKPRDDMETLQLQQSPTPLISGIFLYGRFQPFTRSGRIQFRGLQLVLERLEMHSTGVLLPPGFLSSARPAWGF